MKVIILGAGVVGVTSAYVLATRGHQVTIIDRNDGPAEETSFANGGQLSYSHAEPWATPGTLKKLPKWLVHEESPLIFRPRADLRMAKWGMQFLGQCTKSTSRKNCIDILRLGLYSKEKMKTIRDETGVKFDFSSEGILYIFGREKGLEDAIKQVEFQKHYGGDQRILNREEVLELQPSLKHTDRKIIGGIHDHMDETGDCLMFCQALCEHMQKHMGVNILYNTTVSKIEAESGTVSAIKTDHGDYTADAYVLALASFSPMFAEPHGVKLPIYPMKGYSLTVPATGDSPTGSITDDRFKIVYTRLGDRIRVAGTAELNSYETDITKSRIKPILERCKLLFPQIDWETDRTEWACIRPSTPDGPPRIGKTKLSNLYLNTGHGTLGWTQASGSAYILADIMDNKEPEILSNGDMVLS